MNDEAEQAATAALALGTVFADNDLRRSVDRYVEERVLNTIYEMLQADHPLMRQVAKYVDHHRYPSPSHMTAEEYEFRRRRQFEEAAQRERMERQYAARTLLPKAKMPKF